MLQWMNKDTKYILKLTDATGLSNKAQYLKVVMLLYWVVGIFSTLLLGGEED